MGWFEDQINERRNNENEAMKKSYEAAIDAVMGESFSFDEAEDALTLILRYYHLPPVKLPESLKNENEKLSVLCRLSGLMQRVVTLESKWHKNAFGAYLCKLKNRDEYVAVIPDAWGRYFYYDNQLHCRVRLSKKTEETLEQQAVCFYKPLPAKKLTVFELIKFGISSWSLSDHVFTYGTLLIATGIGLLLPKLSQFLFSTVIEEKQLSLLLSTMFFILSINLSMLLFNTAKTFFSNRTSVKMEVSLKSATMMRTFALPTKFYRTYSSGEILSRMEHMELVCQDIVNMLFSTTLTSLFSLAYIINIFDATPELVLPSLIIILVNILFFIFSTYRQTRIYQRMMEISAKNSGLGMEMISGIQKIKMSGSEKRMFSRYVMNYSQEAKIQFNPPFINKYSSVFSLAITLIGQFIIYFCTLKAGINAAEYYSFQISYGMISGAIASLTTIGLQLSTLKPSLDMIKPMLEEIPENSEQAQEVTSLAGGIELNNISFYYDETSGNVIDDFSLKIRPKEYVAIVGKTGCGKSTLIRLLLGMEKPQKGTIYYDGRDLNLLEKRSLRQKIGTVMQDDKLFIGNIYSNIVICAPTLTLDQAWEAAELAGIADDIRAMPMGMYTLISDGSGGISGGQRQRLAIARAIAPKPSILFFDEATSALDNLTQKKVSEALDSLKCTRIVIAHRLSTIRHCDRIIVMDQGKIIEEGTYEGLIKKKGAFFDLVERQRLDLA